ncbi:Hypothetical protein ORPV_832 [Orpheovirus IHUMI-LCC2]|uniref:Uncharacterized protein n=1 Tax=Orpheovirus IHUMI-LCC2 TaxID=2023057 RepID=A0A2I2L5D9_9VIRU|nr:Hypothetical protein ORPV_832 [Orpheovirus IHUMI-LCC2]SNW62736.1 Hypothetical protein ORPV_832 [Orpheovirus IHUMI-LCC2]
MDNILNVIESLYKYRYLLHKKLMDIQRERLFLQDLNLFRKISEDIDVLQRNIVTITDTITILKESPYFK